MSKDNKEVEFVEVILPKYKHLIMITAKRMGVWRNFPKDELNQIGVIAIWTAYVNHDETKSSLKTYIIKNIRWSFLNGSGEMGGFSQGEINTLKRQGEGKPSVVSIDEYDYVSTPSLEKEASFNVYMEELYQKTNPLERSVIHYLCEGLRPKEISGILDIDYDEIKDIIKDLRRVLSDNTRRFLESESTNDNEFKIAVRERRKRDRELRLENASLELDKRRKERAKKKNISNTPITKKEGRIIELKSALPENYEELLENVDLQTKTIFERLLNGDSMKKICSNNKNKIKNKKEELLQRSEVDLKEFKDFIKKVA